MKETLDFLKQQAVEAKDVAKLQWKSFVMAVLAIAFFYTMSLLSPPGWVSYAFMMPPALVVALTALARVNDIGPEQMGARWQVRRISLIMVGAGAVMMISTPFIQVPVFPSWRSVVLMYGFAGAWMTTPGMPPWDYYMTGAYRFLTHKPDIPRSPLERVLTRITGELSTDELLKRQKEWEEQQKRNASKLTRREENAERAASRREDGAEP